MIESLINFWIVATDIIRKYPDNIRTNFGGSKIVQNGVGKEEYFYMYLLLPKIHSTVDPTQQDKF